VEPGSFRSVRRLLVRANVVPSSHILVTLMMEALSSFETSVLTRTTRRNIPEDGIFHNLCITTPNSYIFSLFLPLCFIPVSSLIFYLPFPSIPPPALQSIVIARADGYGVFNPNHLSILMLHEHNIPRTCHSTEDSTLRFTTVTLRLKELPSPLV
jgi:hypothetical protein